MKSSVRKAKGTSSPKSDMSASCIVGHKYRFAKESVVMVLSGVLPDDIDKIMPYLRKW